MSRFSSCRQRDVSRDLFLGANRAAGDRFRGWKCQVSLKRADYRDILLAGAGV